MKGYSGRILFVDLTSGKMEEESLTESTYRDFIGGVGLGARILYERMKPKVDPLGPDNMLGFMTGPLSATQAPLAAKHMVVTKSPLTHTWGEANSGGFFGGELKQAGFDAVFFSGAAKKPVYLFINEGKADLKDASHIWGKDTYETEKALYSDTGDDNVKFVCIGPAGEERSLIAAVMADRGRAAARSGVGAVMGSKKLKAVAVRGTRKIEVANPEDVSRLREFVQKYLREKVDSLPFIRMLKGHGTCDAPLALVPSGGTPIKNWSLIGKEMFSDYTNIGGDNIFKYQTKKSGCGNCPINCGGTVTVKEGPYAVEGRKPEYETLASLGAMCLNSNGESIIKANDVCDRYGLDTISAGSVIAFAMECYEKGIITKKDTNGIELTWGNPSAIVAMLEKIGKREGFGDVLADGVKKAAERIGKGAEHYAIHVAGQEPGMHDPRLILHRGLGYISAQAPGRHMVAMGPVRLATEGKLGSSPDLKAPEGGSEIDRSGRLQAMGVSYAQAFSDGGLCLYVISTGNDYPLAEFISAVTGWDFTAKEAMTAGKRTLTLLQAFNLREGWKVSDYTLPGRISQPPTLGPFADRHIDFASLRSSYYKSMGWDMESGVPSQACLSELGLSGLVGNL
jgi:aldehyde:ferredoxin oxidoreductase